MQLKHHVILYTFLSLALIIAIFLSMDYGLRAQHSTQLLEDTYAQRISETQEHLQSIGVKLRKAPVAGDAQTQVELLTGVSRQADGVVSSLAALPLSHIAMSDTLKFCNQLSDYAMTLALSIASGTGVKEAQVKQLSDMEAQCQLLLGQFVTARDTMLRESLRLSGESSVFYEEASLSARPLEQVSDKDNGMDYPTLIYDGVFSDARRYGEPKALGAKQITPEEAVAAARTFIGDPRVASAAPAPDSGGPLASYGVSLTLTDGVVLNADVTRQGGQLLWIVPEHASFEPALTLEECTQAARLFLTSRGYGDMEANHYQVYDGLAVINFVAVQDGVLLYPDLVKVQMRMDTGELVGLEANNYLMNHTRRTGLTPTLSQEEALALINPRLQAERPRLCIIPDRDTERLCYEIPGRYDGQEYRVYIDAATGEEAQILLMVDTTDGHMAA